MSVVVGKQVTVDHTGEVVVDQLTEGQDSPVGQVVKLANRGANSVWLGDSNVTDSAGAHPGYELKTTEVVDWVALPPGARLYGMCAAVQSTVVHVLAVGS